MDKVSTRVMQDMEELTGHKLFNRKIDELLNGSHSQHSLASLPRIATKAVAFAPGLAVHLLEEEAWRDLSEEDEEYLRYTQFLLSLLGNAEHGKIQTHGELMQGVKVASQIARKNFNSVMFDLMYCALQFYAYYQTEHYSDLFQIVSGIVYTAGERAKFRGFHQHVDHFKVHAAVFLSADSVTREWRDVVEGAVLLLEKWGDQLPPESVMTHAAHNLSIRCKALPDSDFAYDLVKSLRRQRRDGAVSENDIFESLNEKIGFVEAFEILKVLWDTMAEKYYVYTKGTVNGISNPSDAMEYVKRIKFVSPMGIPYIRAGNGACPSNRVAISFPGGSAIGKTCTLIKHGNTRIIVDYGCDTYGKLPKWSPDIDLLDRVLITHAHQDHVGGLLHLYKKHGYEGKWSALAQSRDLIALSLKDSVKIGIEELKDDAPFKEKDVEYILSRFDPIQEQVEYNVDDRLSFKAFPAGHIHGSCQYLIKSDLGSLYITGDFNPRKCHSAGPMELPDAAELRDVKAVITEGTYAFSNAEIIDTEKAKKELLDKIAQAESFPVLIPVLSLGRAQEVLFALAGEPYSVGVFGLAKEMTKACGFNYPRNIQFSNGRLHDVRAGDYHILVASAGCLQGGPSKYFYEAFNPIHTILTGFLFPGTLAKDLSDNLDRVRYSAHATHEDLISLMEEFGNAKKFLIHYPGTRNIPQSSGFVIPKINVEYEM